MGDGVCQFESAATGGVGRPFFTSQNSQKPTRCHFALPRRIPANEYLHVCGFALRVGMCNRIHGWCRFLRAFDRIFKSDQTFFFWPLQKRFELIVGDCKWAILSQHEI